jgi:hypothetical protein
MYLSHPAEPLTRGRPKYNGVRPGAPRGSLATLNFYLSQCHSALGTMPHTLAWVDQCPCSLFGTPTGSPKLGLSNGSTCRVGFSDVKPLCLAPPP